jgi:hypothetical protein
MQTKNQTNKKKSQRTRSTGGTTFGPPQFNSNIKHNHRFRFLGITSTFSGVISPKMMLSATGVIATVTNTTAALIHFSGRIKSIEMWCPPASQGAAATCSVEWVGGNNSPNVEVSDTSVSVSKPAHLKSKPPFNSLAAFWQINSNTSALFTLLCPVGTIIDLVLDLVFNDQDATTVTTVTTGVLSTIYYLALDHGTSDKLVPVSLQTTT